MTVEAKNIFPTIQDVRELRPGFLPYIVAKTALVDDVLADRVHDCKERPRVYEADSKERDITAAIKGLYYANRTTDLEPPLPWDISEIMEDMVRAFDTPMHSTLLQPAEHILLNDDANLEAARLILELAVAHGYSNFDKQVK